jgi:hypothetical protein
MNNVKMNLGDMGWEGMDWIHLAQDRDQWRALPNTVINLRVPLNVGKFEQLSVWWLLKKDSAPWSSLV